MNFYVNSQGQIIRVDPEDVFQGSVNANTINFIGAFPLTCPVTVAFRLPTGEWTTPASMGMHADLTLPGVQQPDGTQFNIWRYAIPGTVTEHYGTVNLQFYVYAQGSDGNGNTIATASSSFEVKKGVPVVLPDPSDDYETLLTQILSALQQLQQADSEGALSAQQSATAAANSASAAADSATAASNSATIAQTNAQSAQTNAQTAVSAANRAEDSETAAQAAQSAAESAQAAAEAARDEAEALLEGKIENLSVGELNIGDVELTGTSDGILWSDIAVGEEMNGETLHFNTSTYIPYEDFPSASDEILITFENGYKLAVRSQAKGAEIAMLDAGGSVAGPVIYMADGGWMDGLYDFSNAEADSLIVQSMETEETAVSAAAKKFISAVIKTDITLNVDGNISVGSNAIYSSKSPTNANELTRKAYVDAEVNGEAEAREQADTNLQNSKYDKTGGTISGDVVVTGDLTVQGTTTTNDTETLVVKDNLIVTNSDGATLAGLSGLIIRVNSAQSYGIVYDPANEGTVKLGLGTYNAETGVFTFATGEGLPVAVRALSTAWTNLHLAAWDTASNQFVDAGKAVADFQEKLTFDTTPTQNSTNPVTSGGVKSYVDNAVSEVESESLKLGETASTAYAGNKGKQNADNIAAILDGTQVVPKAQSDAAGRNIQATYATKSEVAAVQVTVDSALSNTSENPVQNKVVKEALDGKADTSDIPDNSTLVHTTGNETVAGDKTFTGYNHFTHRFYVSNHAGSSDSSNGPQTNVAEGMVETSDTSANDTLTGFSAEGKSYFGKDHYVNLYTDVLSSGRNPSEVPIYEFVHYSAGYIRIEGTDEAGENVDATLVIPIGTGGVQKLALVEDIPEEYTLPVANDSTLGGVKPVAKTSEMTQNVGVDSNGVLYTKPAPDISEQVSDLSQSVDDIYTILQQEVYNAQDIEQEYSSRETADGADIIDGALETVKKIQGATVKTTNQFDISQLPEQGWTGNALSVDGTIITVTNYYACISMRTFRQLVPNAHAGTYTIFFDLSTNGTFLNSSGAVALAGSSGSLYLSSSSFVGVGAGSKSNAFTVTEADLDRPVYFYGIDEEGITVSWTNLMIVEGDQTSGAAPAYSPYFPGLKNSYFQGLQSTGRNLIPFPYSDGTVTRNGVTFTVNDDGSITVNGTATAEISFHLHDGAGLSFEAGNYTVSGGEENIAVVVVKNGTNWIASNTSGKTQTGSLTAEAKITRINLYVYNGTTFNNVTVYPMLNRGSSALPYEPYVANEISLDAAIELPAWDSINPTTGKRTVQSNTITFDGTEEWLISNTEGYYAYYILLDRIPQPLGISQSAVISNKVETRSVDANSEGCYLTNSNYSAVLFWFKQTAYPDLSTVDAWKAQLAAWNTAGDPLTVCYQTATTTESDISMEDRLPAYKNGSETVIQGATDNSKYGAENTLTQNYAEVKGTTETTEGGNS